MMNTKKEIIQDLGDGLVLRRSTTADTEVLVKFNSNVHGDFGNEADEIVAQWTRDLMSKPHPTFHPDDFTIVEDTKTGEIASCLCLIDQTWAYEGIEFGVGRPELVGTHPDYRRRSLIRKQFDVIHQWSRERGQMLQAITGIPWYYRQFEYEMALELDFGRKGYPAQVPQLNENEEEKYHIRQADDSDLEYITEIHMKNYQRYPVVCKFNRDIWHYYLHLESQFNPMHTIINIIEDNTGKRVGLLVHKSRLSKGMLVVYLYELEAGVSWVEVTPCVLRHLQKTGEAFAETASKKVKNKPPVIFGGYYFLFGSTHPVYDAAPDYLSVDTDPYAWYVRVPDLIGFLQHITPALEDRLARSLAAGHSGDLWLNLFSSGIHMAIENGKIKTTEPWDNPLYGKTSAYLPNHTFLQVLFGHRNIDELHHVYADAYVNPDRPMEAQLFRILFPKKPSNILAIE